MFNLLFLLMLIAVVVVGIILAVNPKYALVGRIILTLASVFVCVPVTFIAVLFSSLFSKSPLFYSLSFLALGVVVLAFLVCIIWRFVRKKAVLYTFTALTVLLVGAIGIRFGINSYIDSIPTISEGRSVIYDYRPNGVNSRVALLDGESTLRLEESEVPKMDGATALYPVYSAFARAVYPEAMLDSRTVACTTTSGAYESIIKGETDIIFVASPSKEQEALAVEKGVTLEFTPIGREAFVFFVNSKNPVKGLGLDDIRGIYTGEITKWSQLGVKGLGDIRAFQRDKNSGSQTTLERLIGDESLIPAPSENVIDGMGGIIEKTADYKNYKNSIGYSFRFYSTEMVKNDSIRLLKINGVAPTVETISDGSYPIASHFYAVTRSDASESTKRLVEWILSEQGQSLIEKTGYVGA